MKLANRTLSSPSLFRRHNCTIDSSLITCLQTKSKVEKIIGSTQLINNDTLCFFNSRSPLLSELIHG